MRMSPPLAFQLYEAAQVGGSGKILRVPRPSLGAVGGHEGLGLADYTGGPGRGDPVLIVSDCRPSLGKPVGKHSDLDAGRHTQRLREIVCVGFFRHDRLLRSRRGTRVAERPGFERFFDALNEPPRRRAPFKPAR